MNFTISCDQTGIDRNKWSDFVWTHPKGNIFQTPEIFDVYEKTSLHEPVLLSASDNEGNILGILLAVIIREYAGELGSLTARSVVIGGPLAQGDDGMILRSILQAYEKLARKKAVYSQYRNLWDTGDVSTIFREVGCSYEPHLNILVDLGKPEETLWREVHSKRRNEIRRASKEGTTVRELTTDAEVAKAYPILHEVYQEARLPLADISLFRQAFRVLGAKGMVRFFGAFNDGELIGVMCVLSYRDVLYDWYAGSFIRSRSKYPNDLLPWEVFKWGKLNGYKTFDFGGAGRLDEEYGVRDYKKKFGGDFVSYGRYMRIHRPFLYRVGRAGFALYKLTK